MVRNLRAQITCNCQPPMPVFMLHWHPGQHCLLAGAFDSAHDAHSVQAGKHTQNNSLAPLASPITAKTFTGGDVVQRSLLSCQQAIAAVT